MIYLPTKVSIVISIIVMVLASCKSDNAEPLEHGHEYFPTKIGSWVEYEVDSVYVDEQFGGDTVHVSYLMRVTLDTNVHDAQGRLVQRLERTVLDTATGIWNVRDIWSQYRDNTAAERTEENLRKLRMVFRIRDNVFWDLNVLNTEDAREMTYDEINVAWSNGSLSFDSTVTAVTTIAPNLIDTVIDTERYAKHVGMVYKRWVETETQYPNGPRTTGFRLTMNAIDHGSP